MMQRVRTTISYGVCVLCIDLGCSWKGFEVIKRWYTVPTFGLIRFVMYK